MLELRSERKRRISNEVNSYDTTILFRTSAPTNPFKGMPHYCTHRFSAESQKLTTRDNLRRDSLATEQQSTPRQPNQNSRSGSGSGSASTLDSAICSVLSYETENTATWVKPFRHHHSPATGVAGINQISTKPMLREVR